MKGSPRILVVEDDAAMRDLLADELREAGFEIVTAADGNEALAQLDAVDVNAVVTDLQMPGLSGDRLLDAVRAHKPQLPVVIITAYGTIDTAVRTIKAGAFHFLPKPFPMEQLVATIEEALNPSPETPQSVAIVERDHILKTLTAVAGNKAAAARLLGLDRKTLYRKLKQYRITPQ
jgi:DNA-binding NtrC family response regulator